MEHRRRRTDQAPAGRRVDPPTARPLRAGRAAALRPGQVVSGRATAAVVLCRVLARRWQIDLAEPGTDRPGDRGQRARRSTTRNPSCRASQRAWRSSRTRPCPPSKIPGISWRRNGSCRKMSNLANAAELDDPMERDRLRRVFERGLSKPSGYVLPVQRWNAKADSRRWFSERWTTRSKKSLPHPGRFSGRLPVAYRRIETYSRHRLPLCHSGRSVFRTQRPAGAIGTSPALPYRPGTTGHRPAGD